MAPNTHSPAIEVQGLEVRYPGASALDGIDLAIAAGSFVLIGGPSGSGKSTFAHTLLGLVSRQGSPTYAAVKGNISVAGLDPQEASVADLATRVGLVFQNPATQLFNGTVEDEVAFGPRNLDLSPAEISDRVAYALGAVGCSCLRGRSVRQLSGGEQQRVAIAATLAMRPSILILDEPTGNLDSEGSEALVQTLARLHQRFGVTVIVIEHRLEPFLPYAERLVWLERRRIAADGSPAETLALVEPDELTPPSLPSAIGDPLVTLRHITAGYKNRPVLQDCSLVLRQGEFAALTGPNGAGKSTLARVLAGLLRPQHGRVIWHTNGRSHSQPVGFLQQNPLHQLVCDTVEKEVHFGPHNMGLEQAKDPDNVLKQTDLLSLRSRPTQALSVGQQQRTAMAATLVLRPRLLILDEPTIGQDHRHLNQTMAFVSDLNRRGQTVLLITHDRRLVERYASRIWSMSAGQVSPNHSSK